MLKVLMRRADARGRHGHDEAGIDAAAQHHPHRHVGNQSQPDGVREQALVLGQQGVVVLVRTTLGERPVGPRAHRPRAHVEVERVSLAQLADAAQHGALAGHVAERQVGVERGRIELARTGGIRQQRLQLGAEGQGAAGRTIVERLLAGRIAGEQQALTRAVVEGQGEHAVETRQAAIAPGSIRFENHFGVGRRPEAMTGAFELGAQLEIVVDLAVEDDLQVAGGVGHRLAAHRRQVDDRQPAMAEAHPPVR